MQITPEFITELINHVKKTARRERERNGFKRSLAPLAMVVGPHGEQGTVPTPFRNAKEKALMMEALTTQARKEKAAAVILVSDTRMVPPIDFDDYFQLPTLPTQMEWESRFLKIVDEQFGGRLDKLPEELLHDAIFVGIKGPHIPEQTFFLPYKEGVGDTIIWYELLTYQITGRIEGLDDWWDKPLIN